MADSLLVMLDEGKESLVFHYRVVRLWQHQAYKMLEQHLVFLYALLPTMEDANYDVLAQALEEMKEYYEGQPKELSTHLLWFDTLLWRTDTVSAEDQRRVKTKMEELEDFLEQSPYVQKKKKEALTQGLQKAFVTFVQVRFPPLLELAQERVSHVTQPDELNILLKQIATIPDETTARRLINSIAA